MILMRPLAAGLRSMPAPLVMLALRGMVSARKQTTSRSSAVQCPGEFPKPGKSAPVARGGIAQAVGGGGYLQLPTICVF